MDVGKPMLRHLAPAGLNQENAQISVVYRVSNFDYFPKAGLMRFEKMPNCAGMPSTVAVILVSTLAAANPPPKSAPAAARPAAAAHAPAVGFAHPGAPAVSHGGFDHPGNGREGFDHGRGFGHDHYDFHGRDVHHFDRFERDRWAHGRWNRTCFDGRCGWWWFASGQWYFYDQPVYPYPLVVAEVTHIDPAAAEAPPPVALRPPPSFRYYCDNPPGFFPQVANCNGSYRSVAP